MKLGPVVFLDVPPGVALARIGAAPGRPLARAWTEILAARLPSYRRATLRLPVGDLSADAVARRILGELRR
jgi:shikimate kinase